MKTKGTGESILADMNCAKAGLYRLKRVVVDQVFVGAFDIA